MISFLFFNDITFSAGPEHVDFVLIDFMYTGGNDARKNYIPGIND